MSPAPASQPASLPAPTFDAAMVERGCPGYWEEARADLIKRDRILRRVIPKHPEGFLVSRGDPFVTLARAITGQQISVKSAQAVLATSIEQLRAVGLSGNKAAAISDLALKTTDGTVPLDRLDELSDAEIIQRLSAVRGIGRWTAEMFLIFHLMRPNVLPLDDVGLINGISTNYFSGEPVSRAEAREVGDAWAPFRSVATWYIWRSLDPLPVDY